MPSSGWNANDMQVLLQARAGLRPGHAGVIMYADIVPLLSTRRSDQACRLKVLEARARMPSLYKRFGEVIDFYHPHLEELEPQRKPDTLGEKPKKARKSRAKKNARASTQSQGGIAGAVNTAQQEGAEEVPEVSKEELDHQRKPDTLEEKPKKARKSRAKKNARASTQSQGGIAGAVNTAQQEDAEEVPKVSKEELAKSEETPESSQPAQQHGEEAENGEDEVDDAETEGSALPSYLTILEECLEKCRLTEKTPPTSGIIPGLGDFLKARLAGKDVAFFDSVEAHCRRYHAVEKTRALTAREKTRVWELRQAAEELKFLYYIS